MSFSDWISAKNILSPFSLGVSLVLEFLDAFSHLYKRVRLSIGPSVGPFSVRLSIAHELKLWVSAGFDHNWEM